MDSIGIHSIDAVLCCIVLYGCYCIDSTVLIYCMDSVIYIG